MVRFASKFDTEIPYSIPNKGPIPRIDREEGLPPGGLDIALVDGWRKNLYHWHKGLQWHERLHAHATLNSIRKHVKCKRPFAPKDELDFVLDSVYSPVNETFSDKMDPYIQLETAFGEDMNIGIHERRNAGKADYHPTTLTVKQHQDLRMLIWKKPEKPEKETWRVLRNRIVVVPDKNIPRNHPIKYADPGGYQRRENIYNVKLGITADHSPQTNPGYSRTPSGAFYSI